MFVQRGHKLLERGDPASNKVQIFDAQAASFNAVKGGSPFGLLGTELKKKTASLFFARQFNLWFLPFLVVIQGAFYVSRVQKVVCFF